MEPININRCFVAMQNIIVEGIPNSGIRQQAIEDAIATIQKDGATALKQRYIGVKNYAGFGDQREDHEYGMGPRHGHIVFSVHRYGKESLGANEVYLLECVRDFGSREIKANDQQTIRVNLCDILKRYQQATTTLHEMNLLLVDAVVDSHEQAQA